MSQSKISLIVPVFNDAEAISDFFTRFDAHQLGNLVNEIILIDDGSSDGSWAECCRVAAERTDVTLSQHPKNRGLGAAIRTGVALANSESVAWAPVDLEIPLSTYAQILADRINADTVLIRRIATRQRRREIVSGSAAMLFAFLFGFRLDDLTGSFVMPRSLFLSCQPITLRAISNLELITRILKTGTPVTVYDSPILRRSAGASRTFSFRTVIRSLRELAGLILLEPSLLRRRKASTSIMQ